MAEEYLNAIAGKEEKEKPAIITIKRIMEPFLATIAVPKNGDYKKQIKEWRHRDNLPPSH